MTEQLPPPPPPTHATIPEGSIIITPAEVYGKVTGLTSSVEKLILQNEQAIKDRTEDRTDFKELEGRVSGLERKLWIFTGAAATLGGTIGSWLPTVLRS